jgi:acetyl-CoA carboxylase biotin carboxyl carrier protein
MGAVYEEEQDSPISSNKQLNQRKDQTMENLKMDHILKIMEQFEKTSIDTLKYKNDGEEILLTKKKNGSAKLVQSQGDNSGIAAEQEEEAQSIEEAYKNNDADKTKTPKENAKTKEEDNLVTVESPIIGTFYTSPSPGKPPFVKKGDKINKGDVICIVEAMKVMNKIESEHSGEIREICLDDGQTVEYGTCLFKIKPD